jgi:hypothetical protein
MTTRFVQESNSADVKVDSATAQQAMDQKKRDAWKTPRKRIDRSKAASVESPVAPQAASRQHKSMGGGGPSADAAGAQKAMQDRKLTTAPRRTPARHS